MFASFVALLTAMAGVPSSGDDKPFYFRSFEYGSPAIEQYKLAGIYGRKKTPFIVELNFRNGQWNLKISSGRGPLQNLRLDKAYNEIPVNRIAVAAGGAGDDLVVLIPFGKPHEECFANGEDVYDEVVVDGGHVTVEHFPKCKLAIANVSVRTSRGLEIVGPPPTK